MDINKIMLFQVVSESDSFSQAAKKLGRTQPAVSQAIHSIENELGVKLFSRRNGRVHLTPEGKTIAGLALKYLTPLVDEVRNTTTQGKELQGKIKLGALMDLSTPLRIGEQIASFCKKYPRAEFEICFGTNKELEAKLRCGEIDLSISILFNEKRDIHQHRILNSSHIFCSSRSYLNSINMGSVEDKISNGVILDFDDEFSCFKPWVKKNYPELVPMLRHRVPNLKAPHFFEIKSAILAGFGMAILPEYLCSNEINDGSIVVVERKSQNLSVGLDIAHLNYRTLRKIELEFIRFLTKAV